VNTPRKCLKSECRNDAIVMSSYCAEHQPKSNGPVYRLEYPSGDDARSKEFFDSLLRNTRSEKD
jgi:hypothetical protein